MSNSIDQFMWRIVASPNPSKGWIVSSAGEKLTRLQKITALQLIVAEHNKTVLYIAAKGVS